MRFNNKLQRNAMNSALRIDRWLYFCRFYKTRVLSAGAVTGGHVKLNGVRATPGSKVKSGDQIELLKERLPYSMSVIEIPPRRGPAAEARTYYLESEDVVRKRDELLAVLKQDRMLMPKSDGRPDKHTRRKLRSRARS
jgi:ribosome-associated heat shock protein Hsp15